MRRLKLYASRASLGARFGAALMAAATCVIVLATGVSAHAYAWHHVPIGALPTAWWTPMTHTHAALLWYYQDEAGDTIRQYSNMMEFWYSAEVRAYQVYFAYDGGGYFAGMNTDITYPGFPPCFTAYPPNASWTTIPGPYYFAEDDEGDGVWEEINLMIIRPEWYSANTWMYHRSFYWDTTYYNTGSHCPFHTTVNYSVYQYYWTGWRVASYHWTNNILYGNTDNFAYGEP